MSGTALLGHAKHPKAWYYELAQRYDSTTKEYSEWKYEVSLTKPNVPDGSIRNVKPLYE